MATPVTSPTVRILLVGDVMTGRGMATVLDNDADSVFADVRHLLGSADIAGANLESPLTNRVHSSSNENQLEADPATAAHLAAAGFDIVSLPNNHSTDAGPTGLLDTIAATTSAGLQIVGGGEDHAAATSPTIVDAAGLTVGFLAFDATGVGTPAGSGPGIASWDPTASVAAAEALRPMVDLLVISIHGGAEYLPVTDPGMAEMAAELAQVGADVVWGHGAHVVQPVTVIDEATVAATSLGNFLFDQSGPDRTTGAMLEVLADDQGVIAYRVGLAEHPDRRIEFVAWNEPVGDTAWLDGSWWNLVRTPVLAPDTTVALDEFRHGDLVVAAGGDVTGDGETETVASFRRPHQTTPFMELHPEIQWADSSGRSAHLGVYDPDGLEETWVAGSVLMPIANLQVCDGSLAIVHDQLDDAAHSAAAAWTWNGFGFDTAPDIPGGGSPGCADINGDGITEPVIRNR